MNNKAHSNYTATSIETTDQGKLILIVYDFAIRNCKLAKELKDPKKLEERCNYLKKAQDAICELICGLNMEAGGEISSKLYSLYDYINRRLVHANVKRVNEPIEEVLGYLTGLRESWNTILDKTKKPGAEDGGKTSKGLKVVG